MANLRSHGRKAPVIPIERLREIVVLSLNNITVGIYTNNLGAYEKVLSLMPRAIKMEIMSYSTLNRKVVVVGDFVDIATPLGIYTISKTLLQRTAA